MKKIIDKWKTDKCGRCSEAHEGYTGKLDANGVEYVICGNTHKRINVSGEGKEGNTFAFQTEWIKINNPLNITAEYKRSALQWWEKLPKSKQRDYEMLTFGYGEWWEDNSLGENDIVVMFQHYS